MNDINKLTLQIYKEIDVQLLEFLKKYIRRLKNIKEDINEDCPNMVMFKVNAILSDFKDMIKKINDRIENYKLLDVEEYLKDYGKEGKE